MNSNARRTLFCFMAPLPPVLLNLLGELTGRAGRSRSKVPPAKPAGPRSTHLMDAGSVARIRPWDGGRSPSGNSGVAPGHSRCFGALRVRPRETCQTQRAGDAETQRGFRAPVRENGSPVQAHENRSETRQSKRSARNSRPRRTLGQRISRPSRPASSFPSRYQLPVWVGGSPVRTECELFSRARIAPQAPPGCSRVAPASGSTPKTTEMRTGLESVATLEARGVCA